MTQFSVQSMISLGTIRSRFSSRRSSCQFEDSDEEGVGAFPYTAFMSSTKLPKDGSLQSSSAQATLGRAETSIFQELRLAGPNEDEIAANVRRLLDDFARDNGSEHARTLVRARNPRGETALEVALRFGNIPAFEVLLAAGAHVNAKTADGKTTLEVALSLGNVPACKALLDAGANVYLKTSDGKTLSEFGKAAQARAANAGGNELSFQIGICRNRILDHLQQSTDMATQDEPKPNPDTASKFENVKAPDTSIESAEIPMTVSPSVPLESRPYIQCVALGEEGTAVQLPTSFTSSHTTKEGAPAMPDQWNGFCSREGLTTMDKRFMPGDSFSTSVSPGHLQPSTSVSDLIAFFESKESSACPSHGLTSEEQLHNLQAGSAFWDSYFDDHVAVPTSSVPMDHSIPLSVHEMMFPGSVSNQDTSTSMCSTSPIHLQSHRHHTPNILYAAKAEDWPSQILSCNSPATDSLPDLEQPFSPDDPIFANIEISQETSYISYWDSYPSDYSW